MSDSCIKTCSKCKINKNICLFSARINKNNTSTTYYRSACKDCENTQKHVNSIKNKNSISKYRKIYYLKNKEKENNNAKAYYLNNKDIINKRNIANSIKRTKSDIWFKLKNRISGAIRDSLTNRFSSKNNLSVWKYLPYSKFDLKNHLELQFEPWMNWDNWGRYNKSIWNDNDLLTWTWNIDHIIPQSHFKYSSMEDENFKKCWSLNNLRPYSAKQNLEDNCRRSL